MDGYYGKFHRKMKNGEIFFPLWKIMQFEEKSFNSIVKENHLHFLSLTLHLSFFYQSVSSPSASFEMFIDLLATAIVDFSYENPLRIRSCYYTNAILYIG